MSKLKQSASDKHQYVQYTTRFEKNQLAKLEKTVREQPNNKTAKVALEKGLDKGVPYKRNRRSKGHQCRGMYKALGFVKNQMGEGMKKSKLDLHWFWGAELCFNTPEPNHGQSMRAQLEELGFKWGGYGKRKYKKTAR